VDQILVDPQGIFRLLRLEVKRGKILFVGLILRFKQSQQRAGFNCIVDVCHVAINLTRKLDGLEIVRIFRKGFADEITGNLILFVFKRVAGSLEIVGL